MKIIFTLSFPATTFSGVTCQKKKGRMEVGARKRAREMGRERRKEKADFLVGLDYIVMVGESLNRCFKFQNMARTQLALPGK